MAPVKATRKGRAKGTNATAARTKGGEKVTEELATALAREAERGYDLSKAERRRVGRPSLGTRGSSPRVTFRAAPKLYRAAQARARREGRTLSELAREALVRYVEK